VVADGPVATLFAELHALHHRAGWPSLREMAKAVGCSHTTISAAFSEPRVPRWGLLELIVEVLGGEVERFHELWLAAGLAEVAPGTGGDRVSVPMVPVPRQLPADVPGFTGRAAALAALDELLSGDAAVALVAGTAGVGKTALALHWSHRVADRFPDGQLYVNLRGHDRGDPVPTTNALAYLLRELGVAPGAVPADQEERAARYRSLVAGRRVLVLLDNAASVEQVRDLLPGSATSRAVVTSRLRLAALVARHGALRVELELLDEAEALALLRRLVGPRVDAEPEAARALVHHCARLPLALRIPAELAVTRPHAALAEVATDLAGNVASQGGRRLDLLADDEDEETAVRTVFSWSFRRLPARAARAFRLLGVHPGRDLDRAGLAALLDTDESTAYRVLDELARAHLLDERGAGRFGMHDLLREYAAELAQDLPEPEREAALGRLREHVLTTARTAMVALYPDGRPAVVGRFTPDQARAWLAAELANLVPVARTAGGSEPAYPQRLAVAVDRYLQAHSHVITAERLYRLALSSARAAGDTAAEAASLDLLGGFHRRAGDFAASLAAHEQALALYRQRHDRAGAASARTGAGIAHWRMGDYGEAFGELTRALSAYEELDDRPAAAGVRKNLGIVCRRLGRYPDAAEHYRHGLQIYRAVGDDSGASAVMNNLAIVYLRQGRVADAIAELEPALGVKRRLGEAIGASIVLINLGDAYTEQGRLTEAIGCYEEALAIADREQYRPGACEALTGLGLALARSGRDGEAVSRLGVAVELAGEIGEAAVHAAALNNLGEAHARAGRPAPAVTAYRSALALSAGPGDAYEQARAHAGLARLAAGAADAVAAQDHAERARALFTAIGAPAPPSAGPATQRAAAR
jgi:tetratricopeptide (TPR) repeat protein